MRCALVVMLLCGIARAEDVRAVLVANCPDCHTRSSPKSVQNALAVFDTDDPYPAFVARMSDATRQDERSHVRQAGRRPRARRGVRDRGEGAPSGAVT